MIVKRSSHFFKFISLIFIVLSIPVALYLVSQVAQYLSRATGTQANLYVDLKRATNVPAGIWRNFAQGGEESNPKTFSTVIDQVRKLRPNYIRIDHIFDFYNVVSRNQNGSLVYNFSQLDQVVNDILAMGAKPYFSLSYMPLTISSKSEVDLPNNMGDWQQLVKATVERYSGRNGKAISNVYYEVWNEPDLFGGFKTYGSKNYLSLYYYAEKGATSAANTLPFKIGGPATTALYENWFTSFFTFAKENNLRVDFYSWHRYSSDISTYEDDIVNTKKWILNYPDYGAVEYHITESGINSKNDKAYDGLLGAIHTIALSTISGFDLNKLFLFEIKDGAGPEKLWGRWGLLTHEKYGTPTAKLRYKAVEFLNRMTGNEISVVGEGSWVRSFGTFDSGGYKHLVVNYDPSGKHYEAVPITYTNLPTNNFTYRRIDFLGNVRERKIATDSASWQTLESFNPNSAAIFELIPQ